MAKPLAIDLFCGLGGWTEGFLAEGYDVVGFDIEAHQYGAHKYPAQLVIQDVLTLYGSQFRNAAIIVASPPCQAYSYRAMPWKRAKALPAPSNELFESCFRIAAEAGVPLIVENVKGGCAAPRKEQAEVGSLPTRTEEQSKDIGEIPDVLLVALIQNQPSAKPPAP